MSIRVAANSRRGMFRVHGGAVLSPGGSWAGTAGSGGTPPAEDTTLRGSGWPHQAIGAFDEPRATYLNDDMEITVGVEHGDPAWISDVVFWCEGRTVTATTLGQSRRTGAIGYVCTLDFAAFPSDGDAQVYAYVRPVNGYEKRLGPITVTRILDATRPRRYVSPSGSDSNSGLSSGLPWASMLKATTTAPDGAVVICAAGTYVEDSNSGTLNSNSRPIEFRRADGLALGDVLVRRSSMGTWQPRARNIIYNGIWIDTANMASASFPSGDGCYTLQSCRVEDSGGVTAGTDTWPGIGSVQIGRQINTEAAQVPFNPNQGQQNCLIDSTVRQYCTAGFSLMRNSALETACDATFFGAGVLPPAVFNTTETQTFDHFEQRRHLAHTLTVASTSFAAGARTTPEGVAVTGLTTLTWNEATTFDSVATGGQAFQNYRFLTGPLAGQQFAIYSQNTGGTTVLYGDATSAVAGDSARGYIVWHADTLQIGQGSETSDNPTGVFFQRYRSTGPDLQGLLQPGAFTGQGTVTTVGTALTCTVAHRLSVGDFVKATAGPNSGKWRCVIAVPSSTTATLSDAFTTDLAGVAWRHVKTIRNMALQLCVLAITSGLGTPLFQWQHGHDHVVVRQTTMGGQPIALRTDPASSSGFATWGTVITDSLLYRLDGTPDYGLTVDSNHVENTGSAGNGTNATTGSAGLDSSYRPTLSGVRTVTPKVPYDTYGVHHAGLVHVGAA